jgi:hypothetical protein
MSKTDKNSPKSIEHKIYLPLGNEEDDAKFQAWCKTPSAIESLNAYDDAPKPMRKALFSYFAYQTDQFHDFLKDWNVARDGVIGDQNKQLSELLTAWEKQNDEKSQQISELLAFAEKVISDIPAARQAGYKAALEKNQETVARLNKQDAVLQKGREKGIRVRLENATKFKKQLEGIMNDLLVTGSQGREWKSDQIFNHVKKVMPGAWSDSTLKKKIATEIAKINKTQKSVSGQ